jgi:hypothetical protein
MARMISKVVRAITAKKQDWFYIGLKTAKQAQHLK